MKVGLVSSFWQSPTLSQHTLNWSLSIAQEFHRQSSEKCYPDSISKRKLNFCLHRFFFTYSSSTPLTLLPPMMIIVFKFLCRQVFECVDISWQSPVLMLLSLCLLILDILVFWVGSSALSGSFIFSQHHGSRGTDAAWFLLLTEGDGYLLHISASKRELISATYLLFFSLFPYQKL